MLLLYLAIICLDAFIKGAMDDVWIREMLECDPSTVKVERSLKRDPASGTPCSSHEATIPARKVPFSKHQSCREQGGM
ncbi:unnamed protein product [Lota lota]